MLWWYFSTSPESLQSACILAVEAFKEAPLCSEVHDVLVSHLKQVFGDDYETVSLAVRSSASGTTSQWFVFIISLICLVADPSGTMENSEVEKEGPKKLQWEETSDWKMIDQKWGYEIHFRSCISCIFQSCIFIASSQLFTAMCAKNRVLMCYK